MFKSLYSLLKYCIALHIILPLASTWFHSLLWSFYYARSRTVSVLTFICGLHDNSHDLIQPNSPFKDILFSYDWLKKGELYSVWFLFSHAFLSFLQNCSWFLDQYAIVVFSLKGSFTNPTCWPCFLAWASVKRCFGDYQAIYLESTPAQTIKKIKK